MDSSLSEASSEILNVTFAEYDISENESSVVDPTRFAIEIAEIEHPVKKVVNEIVALGTRTQISINTVSQLAPKINELPGMLIEIPKTRKAQEKFLDKVIKPRYYANCDKCGELNECLTKCTKCSRLVEKKLDKYFTYLPIIDQIKQTLIRYFDVILAFLNRPPTDGFSDTSDGLVHKEITSQYANELFLSLTVNIDGGKIVEKSSASLWPVQIYQNYLPPSLRFLPENILVVAFYYGRGHPNTFDLMFPLLNDLRAVNENGIQLMYNGIQHDFKLFVVACTCDLLARAMIQNFKNPTGISACSVCIHTGHRNEERASNSIRICTRYRYGKEINISALRTHNDTIRHAQNKDHGVKGLSCLMTLAGFDIIKGVATDYMHGSLLGVTKRIIHIMLGLLKVSTSFKPLSKKNQDTLNKRLKALKPYSSIKYKPRSFEELASFRAIEYKNYLFFYMKNSLSGLLEQKYIDHFELLSAAIYLLNKKTVLGCEIELADELLNSFCDLCEKYYGLASITMNIHLLRHYAFVVRNNGPLWCHSLFGFETNMGVLKKYYNGGRFVVDTITDKYVIARSIKTEEKMKKEPTVRVHLNAYDEFDHILTESGLKNYEKFAEVSIAHCIYKSIASTPSKVSIDYFFQMKSGQIGAAMFFLEEDSKIYVLIRLYDQVSRKYHMVEVKSTENYLIFPFESIQAKVIYLKFPFCEVVSTEPNFYEKC